MREEWAKGPSTHAELVRLWHVSRKTAYDCMGKHGNRVLPPTPESIARAPVAAPIVLTPSPLDLPSDYSKEEATEIFRARIARLAQEADTYLAETKANGNLDQRAKALKTCREFLEILGRHLGLFAPTTAVQINLTENPEWKKIRTILVDALTPYPEASIAVADALREAKVSL